MKAEEALSTGRQTAQGDWPSFFCFFSILTARIRRDCSSPQADGQFNSNGSALPLLPASAASASEEFKTQ